LQPSQNIHKKWQKITFLELTLTKNDTHGRKQSRGLKDQLQFHFIEKI
jgi:hypothetical protein